MTTAMRVDVSGTSLITAASLGVTAEGLSRKADEVARRGLGGWAAPTDDDRAGTAAMAGLRAASATPLVLRLPHVPLRVRLHPAISDELAYYLAVGDYEQHDLSLLAGLVRPGDRVLNLGGGVGVVAAWSATLSRAPVAVVDARADLLDIIADTLSLNGVEGSCRHAAVHDGVPDGTSLAFTVSPALLFSSLDATDGVPVEVPSVTLSTLLGLHRPDVLIVDIEGAERHMALRDWPHRPRVILMEIHTPSLGTRALCDVLTRLTAAGYRVTDVGWHTWVFVDA